MDTRLKQTSPVYLATTVNENQAQEKRKLMPPKKRAADYMPPVNKDERRFSISTRSSPSHTWGPRVGHALVQLLSPRMLVLLVMIITLVVVNHKDSQALSKLLREALSWSWVVPQAIASTAPRPTNIECVYYSPQSINERIVSSYNLSTAVAQCCFSLLDPLDTAYFTFLAEHNSSCTSYPCRMCLFFLQ